MTLSAPIIILHRPQLGENIGSAARVMLNFGLTELRLVEPRDGWPNQAAIAMSSGAARVLDEATVTEDRDSALGDFDYLYATTARSRDYTKQVFTPEDAMKDAASRIAAGCPDCRSESESRIGNSNGRE